MLPVQEQICHRKDVFWFRQQIHSTITPPDINHRLTLPQDITVALTTLENTMQLYSCTWASNQQPQATLCCAFSDRSQRNCVRQYNLLFILLLLANTMISSEFLPKCKHWFSLANTYTRIKRTRKSIHYFLSYIGVFKLIQDPDRDQKLINISSGHTTDCL